ncbi:MAG TPA: IPT/TIG domain-containing protein [Sediminibacterium sp.]|nr:IPT/TIG domain-containing protein [Sediminibacterium sp.]
MRKILQASIGCILLLVASCKKDNGGNNKNLQQPPVISAVTDLENRSIALSAVNYGDWIIIKGQYLATAHKVDFNGVLAADSLLYADDTSVTVKIPSVLPDPADNPITVTTRYGSATYNFRILQPAPVITSFDPITGSTGDTVTITGNHFGGVQSVKFDAVSATIVSSTRTEIKVKVPAGISSAYIYVTTGSGTVKSGLAYGYKYLIFDDALTTTWKNTSFSATTVIANTTFVRRGTNSSYTKFSVGFGAFRVTKSTPALSMAGNTKLKFSLYAGANSLNKKIKIYFNGTSASGYTYTITQVGKWIDLEIPLTNLGNPATITSLTIQEFSGVLQEIYLDDIGLI